MGWLTQESALCFYSKVHCAHLTSFQVVSLSSTALRVLVPTLASYTDNGSHNSAAQIQIHLTLTSMVKG